MARSKRASAFRTISEVADWLGLETHVLRYWETRFKQIKPMKRAGGRRYYRPSDMMLIGGLQKLLHGDGLSIKEAQDYLRVNGAKQVATLSPDLPAVVVDAPAAAKPETADQPIVQALTPVAVAIDPPTQPPAQVEKSTSKAQQDQNLQHGFGQMSLFGDDLYSNEPTNDPVLDMADAPTPPDAAHDARSQEDFITASSDAARTDPAEDTYVEPDLDALRASHGLISVILHTPEDADRAALSAVLSRLMAARDVLAPRA